MAAVYLAQKVHIHYNYGIRSQKTIPTMVLGFSNSIIGVYMDPLGGFFSGFLSKFH